MYGRLGNAAVELLGEWADAATGAGVFVRDAYLTWIKRGPLSVSLVRGNARLFKRFIVVLPRGIGQRFVEQMDVPVLECVFYVLGPAGEVCSCRAHIANTVTDIQCF
jgi:hypothetical protein